MTNQFDSYDYTSVAQKGKDSSKKVPICLVVDTSGSMGNFENGYRKIDELNATLEKFFEFVRNNPRARKIADISIVTFGGDVKVANGFTSIDNYHFIPLNSFGGTFMGGATKKALELLELRRNYYLQNEIERYKPVIILMTDGEKLSDSISEIAPKIKDLDNRREMQVLTVGFGQSFEKVLSQFTSRKPLVVKTKEDFDVLFLLLVSSSSGDYVPLDADGQEF